MTDPDMAAFDQGNRTGFTDGRTGRSAGCSFRGPGTSDPRWPAYALGYLAGFRAGCRQVDRDCTAVEAMLREIGEEVGKGEQKRWEGL